MLYSRDWHNTVNQLYFNKKIKKKNNIYMAHGSKQRSLLMDECSESGALFHLPHHQALPSHQSLRRIKDTGIFLSHF